MHDKSQNTSALKLVTAAKVGDRACLDELLRRDVSVNSTDLNGWTPLIIASSYGKTAIVEFLLERDADVNAKDGDGCTALIRAARGGYTDIVRLLLQHGADQSLKDRQGMTALDRAKDWRRSEIVEILRSIEQRPKSEYFVCIAGEVKSGKSTLLNALVGKDVAGTGMLPETASLSIVGRPHMSRLPLLDGDVFAKLTDQDKWAARVRAARQVAARKPTDGRDELLYAKTVLDLNDLLEYGVLETVEGIQGVIDECSLGPAQFQDGKAIPLAVCKDKLRCWGLQIGNGCFPSGQRIFVRAAGPDDVRLFTAKVSPLSWFVEVIRFCGGHRWNDLGVFLTDTPGTNDSEWNDQRTRSALLARGVRVAIVVLDDGMPVPMGLKAFLEDVLTAKAQSSPFDGLFFVVNFRAARYTNRQKAENALRHFTAQNLRPILNTGPEHTDEMIFFVNAKAASADPAAESTGFPKFVAALDRFLRAGR
ncbi:MAG: ankyrin repeat domain-containing protein [Pseudomonadota bacterium]